MADVSGLYTWSDAAGVPFTKEVLRLDVDGRYPQSAASGTGTVGLQVNAHWVAQPLTATTTPTGIEWAGPIFYKDGNSELIPHSQVRLRMVDGKLQATFSGAGLPDRVRKYSFDSPFFRDVAFEFDMEQGVNSVVDYQTHSHPDRPATLPNETLTLNSIYERAGFRVTLTSQNNAVPSSGASTNSAWSDSEMHDAMQVHFSRIASLPPQQRDRAQWALWTFFAGTYEDEGSPDPNTGGIMFDSIGAAERQGTALFMNSFISNAPPGDTAPQAWRQRMAFWTAAHEMGHAFNLLHAWDKNELTPWIPSVGGFGLMTFMNYPFLYETGSQSDANTIRFFQRFDFRFTDAELLFLRHAPTRFVIMGGSRFGSNHAFEMANVSPAPEFTLELRCNRKPLEFAFLEPVVIELKLTNNSGQPKLIPDRLLRTPDRMVVLAQKRGGEQRAFHPYAHRFERNPESVLNPGESVYESLFMSASGSGWMIDDPGYYSVQVCLNLPDEDVVSDPLLIRIAPPRSWDEEYLAQDFFSDDVGRVLTFDGSSFLESANNTLREVSARLVDSHAALHAQVALAMPRLRPFKLLESRAGAGERGRYRIREVAPDHSTAMVLAKTLGHNSAQADRAAVALGHIDYRYYTERCAALMKVAGEKKQSQDLCKQLHDTLKGRKVLQRVLNEIARQFEVDEEKDVRPRRRRRGNR